MRKFLAVFILALILPLSASAVTYYGGITGSASCSSGSPLGAQGAWVKGVPMSVTMTSSSFGFDGVIAIEGVGVFPLAAYDRFHWTKGEDFAISWGYLGEDAPFVMVSGTVKGGKLKGVVHVHNVDFGCFLTGTIK